MAANAKQPKRASRQSPPQRSARSSQGIRKGVSAQISGEIASGTFVKARNVYGQIIRESRLRLLWNQEHLAERARCNAKTIWNVENGMTQSPDTIERIRAVLQSELWQKKGEVLPWPSLKDILTPLVGPLSADPLMAPSDAAADSGSVDIVENRLQIPQTSNGTASAASLVDGQTLKVLAEGAWPLHQALDKPYEAVAKTVETALHAGNFDVAFDEFRRSLYYSGYHEQWSVRRRLSGLLLRQGLGPRDEAWVRLKAVGYMEMELGNFSRAKEEMQKARALYKKGNLAEGFGQCCRYEGDLYAKFGNIEKACANKRESLDYLSGVAKTESQLELRLFELQHGAEPSAAKLKELVAIGEQLRDIRSWRYWLTELERAKTLHALGAKEDALTMAKHVEFSFRSELTMERTRAQASALIREIQMSE